MQARSCTEARMEDAMPFPWRPIAEAGPELEQAFVFMPSRVRRGVSETIDERFAFAWRAEDGSWFVDNGDNPTPVQPTHFALAEAPIGASPMPTFAALNDPAANPLA